MVPSTYSIPTPKAASPPHRASVEREGMRILLVQGQVVCLSATNCGTLPTSPHQPAWFGYLRRALLAWGGSKQKSWLSATLHEGKHRFTKFGNPPVQVS